MPGGRRDSQSDSQSEASSIQSTSTTTQSTSPMLQQTLMTHTGRAETFLSQLWSILENKQWKSLIYWSTTGTAIVIPDEQAFVTKVASKVYSQSSIQAFNKQMNMWGFNRGPRSLKQLSKKGLGGDSSMHDGKTVHRLWVHPVFVKGASEDERAAISRKLDGGGKKETTKPNSTNSAGSMMKKKLNKRRADYDDDEDEDDDIEDDSDEGSSDESTTFAPVAQHALAQRQSPAAAKPSALPPLPQLPTFANLPPLPQLDAKMAFLPASAASASPKPATKMSLSPLPRISKSPQAPTGRSLGAPPPMSHSTGGKRMPLSSLLPSPDNSKRRKTLPSSAYARGLPTPIDDIESSTDESDEESDSDYSLTTFTATQRPAIASELSPAMGKAALRSASPDDGVHTQAAGPSRIGSASLQVSVSAYGRKSPACLYYAPSDASRYGQPSHSHPTSRHRVVLLTTGNSPPNAALKTLPQPNAPHSPPTVPLQSTTRALGPHDSTSSLFGRPSSDVSNDNLRKQDDEDGQSWKSTLKDGSTSSQEDNALDLGSQRSRDESSIRTGQEFRYHPLPIPSPRLRSPSLSPSGTAALALRDAPRHHDPMLTGDMSFSQLSQPMPYLQPPPSTASSQGESLASTQTSSQPMAPPSVFLNGDDSEGVPFPGTPTPPVESPAERQPRERQNSARSDGSRKSKGKPLARATGSSFDGPAPLMRGASELFPDFAAQHVNMVGSFV